MSVESLLKKYERILAGISDEALVAQFATMGCPVEAVASANDWINAEFSLAPEVIPELEIDSLVVAADSHYLALAA